MTTMEGEEVIITTIEIKPLEADTVKTMKKISTTLLELVETVKTAEVTATLVVETVKTAEVTATLVVETVEVDRQMIKDQIQEAKIKVEILLLKVLHRIESRLSSMLNFLNVFMTAR